MRLAVSISAAAVMSLAMAIPAQAVTLIPNADGSLTYLSIGDTSKIVFNGISDQAVVPGLSATLDLTLASISATTFLFNYTLTNTSTAANARVSGIGFDVDPNVASVSSTGVFDSGSLGGFTAGFSSETCFSGGTPQNCPQGQNNSGVFLGTPGSGTLSLVYGAAPSLVTLSNFLDRYQGFNVGGVSSAVGQGTPGRGGGGLPPPAVPEPATWLLMLVGFGAVGAATRRQRDTNLRVKFRLD